jgi:cobalt-zinc-cadmium efflux system membrane fusion protein
MKSGVIMERHATLGEFIAEGADLFLVMDVSELWADLMIFQRDISKVKTGQEVDIAVASNEKPFKGRISFISPIVDEATQSRIARAVVDNGDLKLAPGAFVTGEVSIAEYRVPLAVTYNAIQTVEGKPVVFVQEGDRFELREVGLGRSDGTLTEVLSGVSAGEKYVAENSFILKAELGKSEAEHEH